METVKVIGQYEESSSQKIETTIFFILEHTFIPTEVSTDPRARAEYQLPRNLMISPKLIRMAVN